MAHISNCTIDNYIMLGRRKNTESVKPETKISVAVYYYVISYFLLPLAQKTRPIIITIPLFLTNDNEFLPPSSFPRIKIIIDIIVNIA